MRHFLTALALLAAVPAVADETTGTILAFDRFDRIIVLTDKTIWQLAPDTPAPAQMSAGDTVRISFDAAGEDGIETITSVTVLGQ